MTNVLIATDGSEQSLAAARYLKTLVAPGSVGRLAVIAVVRPLASVPFLSDFSEGPNAPRESAEEPAGYSFQREARAAVERLADEVKDLASDVETFVWSGSPAEEIVRASRELGSDLIVIGSRGTGAVDSVLMGSVSHRVLHYASCPVLVVRPT